MFVKVCNLHSPQSGASETGHALSRNRYPAKALGRRPRWVPHRPAGHFSPSFTERMLGLVDPKGGRVAGRESPLPSPACLAGGEGSSHRPWQGSSGWKFGLLPAVWPDGGLPDRSGSPSKALRLGAVCKACGPAAPTPRAEMQSCRPLRLRTCTRTPPAPS